MPQSRDMSPISPVAPLAHKGRLFLMAAAMTALLVMPAAQAQQSDAERCATVSGQPDLAIKHCTRAIESGKVAGEDLAKLHYNRGIEWAAKGEHQRAIADYDSAIRLDPKFAEAYFNRGHAWANRGDPDRAIADYGAAIRLNPKDPAALASRAAEWLLKGEHARAAADFDAALKLDPKGGGALFGRGRAKFYAGDFAGAAADMEQALKIEPNSYSALWLYLARKRAGDIDADEKLDAETRSDRASGWPGQLVLLYLGRTDLGSVQAAATDRVAKIQSDQQCEASFYLAHWHLLRDERDRALPLLKQAQAGCPRIRGRRRRAAPAPALKGRYGIWVTGHAWLGNALRVTHNP
jgi:lipoprotein NlpI